MLADLMYQKNQSDTALKHFQQLLERNPSEFHVQLRQHSTGGCAIPRSYSIPLVDGIP